MLLGGCIFLNIDLVKFTLKNFFLVIFTAGSQLGKTVITWLPCQGALSHVTQAPHLSFQATVECQCTQDKNLCGFRVHLILKGLSLLLDIAFIEDHRGQQFSSFPDIFCSKENSKMYLALSNLYYVLIWTWRKWSQHI